MPSQVVESRGRIYAIPARPAIRNRHGLYPMADPDLQAIEDRYNSITKPLTLLSDFPSSQKTHSSPSKDGRPTTPVEQAVTGPSATLGHLNNVIRKRICPNSNLALSLADQQTLASIILGEVATKWKELKNIPDHPLIDEEQNKELIRRIYMHVVTVCEELFFHYNQKLELLNNSGVFTGPANIARLRAQLALDADRFLDIDYIRRKIAREFYEVEDDDDVEIAPAVSERKKTLKEEELFRKSRPYKPKNVVTLANRQIKEMMNSMPPDLDMDRVNNLLPKVDDLLVSDRPELIRSRLSDEAEAAINAALAEISPQKTSDEPEQPRLTRSKSHDNLRTDIDNFEDVLGEFRPKPYLIDKHEDAVCAERRKKLPVMEVYSPPPSPRRGGSESEKPAKSLKEEADEDLEKRSKYTPLMELSEKLPEEEELPPLLQASSKYNHVEGRLEALKEQLAQLEQKEKDEIEQQKAELFSNQSSSQPLHPQPATISTKFPNCMVARTNDVRVSDRVSINSLTLKSYQPLYNDLTGDIDQETVRQLDAHLYYPDQLNEVYQEMLGSDPNDHTSMDNDPEIEPCAHGVDLSSVLASSTLARRPNERVINPEFVNKGVEPPWQEQSPSEWKRTLDGGFRDTKDMLNQVLRNKDAGGEMPEPMDVKARDYSSWLTWWKSMVNSDDYMKFLSTLESDYLAVLFHFYNSDDEGEDEDEEGDEFSTPRSRLPSHESKRTGSAGGGRGSRAAGRAELRRQKIQRALEKKQEYQEGMWNAQTVLLGGLGKMPAEAELEAIENEPPALSEEEDDAETERAPFQHNLSLALLEPRERKKMEMKMKTERKQKKKGPLSLQERLEKVWNDLRVPDQVRLDMALKYSGEQWSKQIKLAIECWERCSDAILAREAILVQLEDFERTASDPDRFFKKGTKGSSKARIEEAAIRQAFDESLKRQDRRAAKYCQQALQVFGDTVSYSGRPYLQKMKSDRVEMLYWLQQERREKALERELMSHKYVTSELQPISGSVKKAMLNPISS